MLNSFKLLSQISVTDTTYFLLTSSVVTGVTSVRVDSEGPSGGSRAAAAVADGCREVEELSSPAGDWSRSACISATTIPVAELVDTWPPISSGSA